MYRVVVKNGGKYNNVMPGARYCFTKRSVIYLAALFMAVECECEIEKFIRVRHDIFCWSDVEVGSDVWCRIYEALKKRIEDDEDEEEGEEDA